MKFLLVGNFPSLSFQFSFTLTPNASLHRLVMVGVQNSDMNLYSFNRIFGMDALFAMPREDLKDGPEDKIPVFAYTINFENRVRLPEVERNR